MMDGDTTEASIDGPVYSYVDPLALPPIDQHEIKDSDKPLGVWREPPGTYRQFLRAAPEFIDDPDHVGLFPQIPPAVYTSSPGFVATVADATLVGYRTILGGGHLLDDYTYGKAAPQFLDKLAQAEAFPNEETGLRRIPGSDSFRLAMNGRAIREIDQTVITLNSTEPSNFGSFLFRVLPKLTAIRQLGLQQLPILVYLGHPSYTRLFELLGADKQQLIPYDISAVTKVKRVIVPSIRNPDAFLDYQSRTMFRHLAEAITGGARPRGIIYVSRLRHSRNSATTRVMLNEAELVDRLRSAGVEILEPETKSSDEQVKAFASAQMVIGPSGAGMFNVVFCRPGTKIIDIESEPHWIYAHSGLFASSELRYGLFVGRADPTDDKPVHRRWTVNIDALIERVRRFALA